MMVGFAKGWIIGNFSKEKRKIYYKGEGGRENKRERRVELVSCLKGII